MTQKNHKIDCKCTVCKIKRNEIPGIGNYILNNSIENHPRYVDGRTLKKYYCIDCNKEISITSAIYGSHKCRSCIQKGKILTDEHKQKIKLNFKKKFGKDNNNWQGGKSFEEYGVSFNQQLKERVRVRDNFICQLCYIPELEFNRRLSIHHIDYNKQNNNLDNLISLCNSCHQKTNSKQTYWTEFFQEKRNGIRNNRK